LKFVFNNSGDYILKEHLVLWNLEEAKLIPRFQAIFGVITKVLA